MLIEPMLSRLDAAQDLRESFKVALDNVVALHGAEKGNIQLFDAQGHLVMVAQTGLSRRFLKAFERVALDAGTVCSRAAARRAIVFVDDVERDEGLAPYAALARSVPFRAVLSAPLITTAGRCIGVVSAHFANTFSPTALELESLESYCRQVADAIVHRLRDSDWTQAAEQLAAQMWLAA
jgi:GAF domain-containing protein